MNKKFFFKSPLLQAQEPVIWGGRMRFGEASFDFWKSYVGHIT
jgi:hypothetical protein